MQRIILSILLLPVIGCAPALAQVVSDGGASIGALASQAVTSPGGVSWPIAVVIVAGILARECRRGAVELAEHLKDWRPPTITLRLDDARARPIETRTRATDGLEGP